MIRSFALTVGLGLLEGQRYTGQIASEPRNGLGNKKIDKIAFRQQTEDLEGA